ncbi:hypothetical protein [Dokdonia sp.]|uniref:hypothetical protein n=1 Tax=Dokdonia sp. TaxID=2024995 RepID=UPI0032667BB7
MKTLSKYNPELKITIPVIISFLIILIVFIVLMDQNIPKYIVLFGILIVCSIWIHKRYTESYRLFFNEKHFLLKNKNSERNIALEDIKRVKSIFNDMKILGSQIYQYEIDFENEIGVYETINFYISGMNSSILEFKNLVKLKSPNTNIEDFTKN